MTAHVAISADNWPYHRWIAHRGAGKLAPENTLAAFRLGASFGYRMFECDVKLSADGVPFLLHDAGLERTTNGHGAADRQSWAELALLDAGQWHSRGYAGEPLPTLETIARYCLANNHLLNIELKPSPGAERQTGEVVANEVHHLWQGAAVPPLLTSFQPDSLYAAQAAQPQIPRGLLLNDLWTGWVETALVAGCVAVVCDYTLWDQSTVTQARSAGFRCLSYTVNDPWAIQYLDDLGTDGFITDQVSLFSPAT